MFHVPQSGTSCDVANLDIESIICKVKTMAKNFHCICVKKFCDHKLDFNHHFCILETTQQKLQLLN